MKCITTLLASASLLFVSCTRFDDSAIWEELRDHEERIQKLEALCNQLNENISSLQTIVTALQENDYITNIVTITEEGVEVGYIITFSKSGNVTIYHGKDGLPGTDGKPGEDGHTPVIGVRKDGDGIYYWTLDGVWLLDDQGNKIPTTGKDGNDGAPGSDGAQGTDGKPGQDGTPGADGKDGVTPLLKIEDDYWYISYDDGKTWERLYKAVGEDGKDGSDGKPGEDGRPGEDGADGDSMFSSVDVSNTDYVIFALADGTQVKIPTWKAFEELQSLVNKLNTNLQSLQTAITALESNDYVTSVFPVSDNGLVIGYTITFSKSGTIVIYHGTDGKEGLPGADGKPGEDGAAGADGKPGQDGADGEDGHTPVIGVRKDADGIYYWTLDGEWLLDDQGNRIPTTGKDGNDGAPGSDGAQGTDGKDGVTPELKIEDGCWYISYDKGDTWAKLGEATGEDGKDGSDGEPGAPGKDGEDGAPGKDGKDGDSMFSNVEITEDYVIITMTDGTPIKLPTWKAFEELQTLVNKLNTNLQALQTIVAAIEDNDYVTSVIPLTENGLVIGYTITFSKSGAVVIYHGINGKDGSDGNPGEEGKPGVDGLTPQFKIENGNWHISYDEGQTWLEIGKASGDDGQDGDAFFKSVTQDDYYVYLTLSDDTVFTIPTVALIESERYATSEVRLAKQYDLVVGDNFQLFYMGVVKAYNIKNEGIRVICNVGKQMERYFEYTPTEEDAGKKYKLTITTRRLDGSVISRGETYLVVHPKLTDETTPANVNILIFGDSLTSACYWGSEGLRRIYGSDLTKQPQSLGLTNMCTTYGNKYAKGNAFPVYHEGYPGWTWGSFLRKSEPSSTTNNLVAILDEGHGYDISEVKNTIWQDNNGLLWKAISFPTGNTIRFSRGEDNDGRQDETEAPVTFSCESLGLTISPSDVRWECSNPFYNPLEERIDFKYHASTLGNEGADIIAMLLTWNGGTISGNYDFTSGISKHMYNATLLLRQAHNDFPDAKIICMGLQISSLNGGTGESYGADGGYSDPYATAFYAFDYNKALEELVTNEEFGQYCYYVDTKGQFDTEYNMPNKKDDVNDRNNAYEEIVGTNGVHPSLNGYYQIGDAFYRALHKVLPLIK